MADFDYRSGIEETPERVFAWHDRPGAFERLIPPWQHVRVARNPGTLENGAEFEFEIKLGPAWVKWIAEIGDVVPGQRFVDRQKSGPFASWEHTHDFVLEARKFCLLEDHVRYELPGGAMGRARAKSWSEAELARAFRFRHERTRNDVQRHKWIARYRPIAVAVSGTSGLIGGELMHFLTAGGHRVIRLVRGEPKSPGEARWDPATGQVDAAALEGIDAVVHLAAENVADGRWDETKKRRILESRRDGTRLLCETIAKLSAKPKVLVCASATGFYGDRGDAVIDEAAPRGEGFLAEVCEEWERACDPAREAGVRVVNLRIAPVITARGGALQKMLPAFRAGLGARLGDGRQLMPWISLDDLLGAIYQSIYREQLDGPVNAVSPEIVTNAEFTKTLAAVLNRPAIFRAPKAALKIAMGELADELFASQNVKPARLLATDFHFYFQDLKNAICSELGVATDSWTG
ncbi:TIGR01777 family oxidoreductase [bacterium]|nr:TIGR01777 family oxidoreductase [bacterium]